MEWFKQEILDFKDYDFSDPRILDKMSLRRRRSPVIVEITDVNISPVEIYTAMEAGMNAIKFKMYSSTLQDKIKLMKNIRKATKIYNEKNNVSMWPIATCAVLKSCMVKTGLLDNNKEAIFLEEGSRVILTNDINKFDTCNEQEIFIDNPYLTIEMKVGMEINISQEEIVLVCTKIIGNKAVCCTVIKGGFLTSMCSVTARQAMHLRPYLTKKDLEFLKFCIDYQVDIVIIYYVQNGTMLRKAKQYFKRKGVKLPIFLCGICTQSGLDNFEEILKECDGIIMARDYLPFEIEKSKQIKIPQIQKFMSAKCQMAGKPFYISGGVLKEALAAGEKVAHELSDITNSILDGVTGFILNDCFNFDSIIHALNILNDICCEIEPISFGKTDFCRMISEMKIPINAAESAVMSCAFLAYKMNIRIIILPTVTGRTLQTLMFFRPASIIITVSKNPRTTRLLYTCRGVIPLLYKAGTSSKDQNFMDARIEYAVEYAVTNGWLMQGDTFLTLQRFSNTDSFCDSVRIWNTNYRIKELVECKYDTEMERSHESLFAEEVDPILCKTVTKLKYEYEKYTKESSLMKALVLDDDVNPKCVENIQGNNLNEAESEEPEKIRQTSNDEINSEVGIKTNDISLAESVPSNDNTSVAQTSVKAQNSDDSDSTEIMAEDLENIANMRSNSNSFDKENINISPSQKSGFSSDYESAKNAKVKSSLKSIIKEVSLARSINKSAHFDNWENVENIEDVTSPQSVQSEANAKSAEDQTKKRSKSILSEVNI